MKLKHKVPCKECPWRIKASKGWLGGHPAELYTDALQGNEIPACHQADHGPRSARTAMCVGALAVAANSCTLPHKTPGATEAVKVIGKRADCFAHPRDFFQYHTGRIYQSYLLRLLDW